MEKGFSIPYFDYLSKTSQNQNDVKSLNEKIHKYQQKINKKLARISVVEAQLNKDSNAPELSLDSLRSQHNNLTDTVNKLQSQADEIKQSDGPKVGKIGFRHIASTSKHNFYSLFADGPEGLCETTARM